jgi:hypothetical protein
MTAPTNANFKERVVQAAEAALKHNGSVGPLELFQQMSFLQPVHVEGWRKGIEHYAVLQSWIQVGQEKLQKTIDHFLQWANERGLKPLETEYTARGRAGIEALYVTADHDPDLEKFYRTLYVPAGMSEKKTVQLAAKVKRPPELVVFEKVSEEGKCSECAADLSKGDFLFMEKGQPLCLACADLDQLVFLPAGDTALTRRARKYSSLAAVVVRFSQARGRYERQGLLVNEEGLARAQDECDADAPARAVARARATIVRQAEDREFETALAQAILQRYPRCPRDEARQIAEHTGRRSSGRVGRSAAGRALETSAIDLAVIAHIRHQHTNYDKLLMAGADRLDARAQAREKIDGVLARWSDQSKWAINKDRGVQPLQRQLPN